MTPRALPDVVISALAPGEFLLSNVFTRTHAVGDTDFVALMSGEQVETCRVVVASVAPFQDGLLGDPTGLDRDVRLGDSEPLGSEAALELAAKLRLVAEDEAAYDDYLRDPRSSVIDRAHHGNLHQRVGEYVMFGLRRRSVDDWWVGQKFDDDMRLPREGLYRSVQWAFAQDYYRAEQLDCTDILDFGCGPGLFARLFASRGARVLGLDTNELHLEKAAELAEQDGVSEHCKFALLELPPENGLEIVGERRFDRVFLSDVLMFYFHPYDPALELDPAALLTALAGLLVPGGCIEVLEPNGSFWQQPWLGSEERPFTVLTEYRNRHYGVTPTLEKMSRAAEAAGLAITRIREPGMDGSPSGRGESFSAEFPPWWFFQLEAKH
jgi:SAM-dependent methyltransferase